MTPFEKSQWIWADCKQSPDQYTEYRFALGAATGQTELRLSCDSDYTLWINGNYVASNQYGDFEHYKIYDTLDITAHLTEAQNEVLLLVWYFGADTQRYKTAPAGLIFEVTCGGELLAVSGAHILSRLSPAYVSGRRLMISPQLGFSFSYDATKECDGGFARSVTVEKQTVFYPRPTPKMAVGERACIKRIETLSPTHYLVDLGTETVGLATLEFFSECEQQIVVAWGESLDDGAVRKCIGPRHFHFEYKTRKGENRFTNYMLRLGCRYLEIFTEAPVTLGYVGLLPQTVEVAEQPVVLDDAYERELYRISRNTLRLCMMEHYVDTPWREQCLYAFDSRNQMLCGYYAFEGGNREYARANLALIGEDRRDDGLLSISYPCGITLAIPSFSLYYVIAMREYLQYTGDVTLARKYLPKLREILTSFLANAKDGVICRFSGEGMWNFYDWSPYLAPELEDREEQIPDLVINALFLMATDAYRAICAELGENMVLDFDADALRARVHDLFLRPTGLFALRESGEEYTELGNALAVLSGVARGEECARICRAIISHECPPASLSMNIWKYDALMHVDAAQYGEWILQDLREQYRPMIEAHSDTVWETAKGSVDFHNAGSLCHGWSAVPIYIYHKLGRAKGL